MDKEQRAKLLTEIMEEDQKNGLYEHHHIGDTNKMVTMKLYTEEQVRQSFIAGMEFIAVDPLKYEQDANEYMNSITPIELPSDEEIEQYATFAFPNAEKIGGETYTAYRGMKSGAKWMRDKILNK